MIVILSYIHYLGPISFVLRFYYAKHALFYIETFIKQADFKGFSCRNVP